MSPAELRQHAAVRFMTTNKQDWADKAVAALRHAADVNEKLIEALQRIADPRNTHFAGDAQVVARAALELQRAAPVVAHVPADDTEGGAL